MEPLVRALRQHVEAARAPFHTPGHKGHAVLFNGAAWPLYDLTELPDTASLFDGGDALEASERAAEKAFGSAMTVYSAGGCTLCIQTMLALHAGGKLLMGRNAHRSAVNAAALQGVDVAFIWPDARGEITPAALERAIEKEHPAAVYLTSPDYYGNLTDITGAAAVCHRYGLPLLVDNAHGSHLGAVGLHPLSLGADMTADSCHKTLPVLTGGAMLHSAKPISRRLVKDTMALFGSTSPSFLTLASLDAAQAWWAEQGVAAYQKTAQKVALLRQTARDAGIDAFADRLRDPTRLTLDAFGQGLSGMALAEQLRERGIEPEMADNRYVVLIVTPFNTDEELDCLERALREPFRPVSTAPCFDPFAEEAPEAVLSAAQAIRLPCREVATADAAGHIAARAVCPCPPGIAAAVPGERISPSLARRLADSGITRLTVVDTKKR